MSEKYLPMDQTETTQAGCSTRRDPTGKDVFLSHSGKQKSFIKQLFKDLTDHGVSCFFDQDRESLPVAEDFPSIILEAVKTCKIALLLLSKDFLESKWPMLELSAFVEARDRTFTNSNLKILPLFFLISPDALKDMKADNEKWKQLKLTGEQQAEWLQALKAIRPINGINFRDGEDEVEFREKIVKEILRILPPSQRYHIFKMEGGGRMCQEVTDFFKTVRPNEKGILIAGLYGIAGHGKTLVGKAFCNLKLTDFEGKVCHLEFSRGDGGDSFERRKLALRYLTQCPRLHLETLTKDQAEVELYKRLKGQRVLLVLDNITEESIEEVKYYIQADLSENSYILLSARSVDVLVKHFKIDSQSCMHVPILEEDDAIAILLESTTPEVSTLDAESKAFALKCANRCSFSCDIVRRGRTFHPLALKAFGRHLFGNYGWNLSIWAAETHCMVDRSGYGLDDVLYVLRIAFDGMCAKNRTIFMLLTIYMLPNMSRHKVTEWLAINCNEEISFINKAVQDLCKKAFIEEFEPEIRIHDLYIEFAQSTANQMGRWLWWKGDRRSTRGLISQDQAGFELAKLEQCMHRRPSLIPPRHLENLLLLQLVGVKNMSKLDFRQMYSLRSITLQNCKDLAALEGIENLVQLAWLQISEVNPMFKLPELSSFEGLQHLEIDIAVTQVLDQLSDLTPCSHLREINVRCPSLQEFPRLNGLPHLEKVEFSACGEVKGSLDCTDCVMLQSIVLNGCRKMAASPVVAGCKKLYNIVLSDCDAVTACPDIGDEPSALKTLELSISSKAASAPRSLESCDGLENLHLWNMGELKELPNFNRLSNLTVLKIGKCGIREPPDLTRCLKLENISFFTLQSLESFPNFSLLRELKSLYLYNCRRVRDPPDISGCRKLQVFHLVCNDNMKGLPKMLDCAELDEIKVSWHCEDEVTYEGIDPDSWEVDDNFLSCLEHFKDETTVENFNDACIPIELRDWLCMQEKRWMDGRTMLTKKYFRGVKLYCSVTASYELYESSNYYSKNYITLRLVDSKVIAFPTPGRVSKDRDWLNKVREYFAGKKDIAHASTASEYENSEAVSLLLPRYHIPPMQGEARMCQEVADFLNTVHPNEKGIRIAGLYGMSGLGKTTLGKAFCNLNLGNYDGKVFHTEFCGGNVLETQKLALQYLTHSRKSQFEWVTGEDDVRYFFCTMLKGQRVLLVLDNITEDSIDKVRDFLGAELGKNSYILLTARSIDVLRNFDIDSQSCMRVPRLEEEEAIAILLERTSVEVSALEAEDRGLALKCAKSCSIEEDIGFASRFHPLALKAFGRYLHSKHGSHLSKWVAQIDSFAGRDHRDLNVFAVLGKVFDDMDPKSRSIFMLLTVLIPPKLSSDEVIMGLVENCKEEVEDLYKNGFFEEIEPQIRIHDAMKESVEKSEVCMWQVTRSSPLPPRYRVPAVQGEARMCQEVADLFNTVRPNEKGIRIAGLYGMPGHGKTTLSKAFCNLNLENYDGKVCHLEFCGGNTLERRKLALKNLTHCPQSEFGSVTSKDEALVELYRRVKGTRILLILDNIDTDESIGEARDYLGADVGEGSCILLIARSEDVLLENFDIKPESCMGAPSLTEEETIAILLEKALEKPALSLFCQYAFGIPTIRGDLHHDKELWEQVQAESRDLPAAVQVIVRSMYGRPDREKAKTMLSEGEFSGEYHTDGLLTRLKTNIDALDDNEKQCFLDLVAFPRRKSIPANALLDIWVYVRGMNRDKAVVLLLKFAARHLLHLGRNTRLLTVGEGYMSSYSFFQDDILRNLALFLAEHDNRIHFRRMNMPRKQSDFYPKWLTDRYQSSKAQIVSIHTGAMTDTQWQQVDFPEVEALVLYSNDREYCIPPFLFKMEKLKVLIIYNDSEEEAKFTGPNDFQALSQLKTLRVGMLIVTSLFEYCKCVEEFRANTPSSK